jgi:dTDP-4-dehydrorhamnose 3,5-epimerase
VIFTEATLKDVFLIDPEPVKDERGMFMRIWCEREFDLMDFRHMGWPSVSMNTLKGRLRGFAINMLRIRSEIALYAGSHL